MKQTQTSPLPPKVLPATILIFYGHKFYINPKILILFSIRFSIAFHFFKIEIHSMQAEQSLQGMELQEKEAQKD